MTTWLESSNTHQDGTPVTRKIKIPEMGEEIWFTDNAYAEVSDDVADILANNIDSISKVAEPSSPGTYYGDANSNTTIQVNVSDGSFDSLTAESIASDALETVEQHVDRARISENESVAGKLSRTYVAQAADSQGNHFALHLDGSDAVLYRTTTPRDAESYEEVNRFSNATQARNYGLHVTANGTLLIGVNNSLRYSTDLGDTFTTGASLTNSHVWSFSEDSSGSIYIVERGAQALKETTDEGSSLTTVAEIGTEFGFADHIHMAAVHPASDDLYVTGGDGTGKYWYRSTDGGSTWDEYTGKFGAQYVAICGHPTDSNIVYFGHDSGVGGDTQKNRGIVRADFSGGSLTQTFVQRLNIDNKDEAAGSFSIRCIHDPNDPTASYWIASSYSTSGENEMLWTSLTLEGLQWRAVERTADWVSWMTTQAGAYGRIIDPNDIDTIVGANRWVNLTNGNTPLYGMKDESAVDMRRVRDGLEFEDIGENTALDLTNIQGGSTNLVDIRDPESGEKLRVFSLNNRLIFRSSSQTQDLARFDYANTRIESDVPMRFWDGARHVAATDLSSTSPSLGEVRRHDGSDGSPLGLYEGKDTTGDGSADTWVEMSPADDTATQI